MPHITLVEDEAAIADALVFALQQAGFTVSHFGLGRQGLAEASGSDLLILDLGLPDIDGLQVLRELRAISQMPVILLTARSDEIDRVLGLELGADDYVAKPFSPRELLARVRNILRRAQPAQTPMALRLDPLASRIYCGPHPLTLTRFEFLLLKTLMQAPGRVYSRSQLLDLVWTHEDSQERTVDTHIKSLRAKIADLAPGMDCIETHRGLGYSYQP